MSDVDKLQVAEEAAAQRAEDKASRAREAAADELREEPVRGTARGPRHSRAIAIEQIHPGDNIRLDLPEIQELALSIREVGLLTPLIVRPWDADPDVDGELPATADSSEEQYRLIAGHRRHAALTALVDAGVDDHASAMCEVREGLSEAEAYALMLTENVQRVPLEPIQAARAIRLLLDLNGDMDAGTLARSLGLRPAWASTHLKLLDLPQEVQDRLEAGDLSVTIADLLRRGQTTGRINEAEVKELAAKVANGEITTAQAREKAGPPPKPNTPAPKTLPKGPDGRPVEPSTAPQWYRPETVAGMSDRPDRPATPMGPSTSPPPAPMPGGPVPEPSADGELPLDEQLDAYLLARVLEQWADDEYLDEIGIDRVMCEAWARALTFDERINAIRDVSFALRTAERAALLV